MKKGVRFGLVFFVSTLVLFLLVSYGASLLAFGVEEEETWINLRQISYRIFLFFRFPSHHLSFISNAFPALGAQLVVNSFIYAVLATCIAGTVNAVRS